MPGPSPAVELLDQSRSANVDASKEHAVRRFLVYKPPEAALTDPTLPQLGSVYPGGNINVPFPLILDSYSVAAVGDGVNSFVNCNYTNDRSGRLNPQADKTRADFQSASVNFQEQQVKIPTVTIYPLKVSGAGAGGNPTETNVGESSIYEIVETRTIYTMSVVVQGFINATTWHLISAQNNTMHKIQGRWYLFKAGNIHQTEKSAWETQYSWVEDLGTRTPTGLPGNPGGIWPFDPQGELSDPIPIDPAHPTSRFLYLPPATFSRIEETLDPTYNDPFAYIRSPYHTLSFYMDDTTVPHWVQVLPYTTNDAGQQHGEGWKTLPGNLNL